MDDVARQALETELSEALKRRERLDVVIAYLQERLGVEQSSPSGTTEQAGTPTSAVDHHAEPAASVRVGEFYGMSSPDAARLLLEKFGRTRPMKTDEIFEAITKGGVKIASSAILYRSLTRDTDFLRVGRGTWGLAEWYPASARKQVPTNGDEEADENRPSESENLATDPDLGAGEENGSPSGDDPE